MDDVFRPARWLRNPHVQSMLCSTVLRRRGILRRAAPVIAAQRSVLLDCGAGVRLQCLHSSPPQARGDPVVLLHGWEGSADSNYMLSLAGQLFAHGYEVVRLNLRDHGDTHHLNRELFHSCRLPEVVGAIAALNRRFPGQALTLVGYSLGGNFMLRVATREREARLNLARLIAISPVLDPHETLVALERSLPAYQLYFVRKWRRSLKRKQAAWPTDYDFDTLSPVRGLRAMTRELVLRCTEFETLESYLNGYAITGDVLARLTVPARIITSADDPIIPIGGLERIASPACLRVTVTRYGGHCGFFERLDGPTWVETQVLAELEAASRDGKQAESRRA